MGRAVWIAYTASGRRWARRTTRTAAMNSLEKPHYCPGRVRVINQRTGQCWQRRRGSWFPAEDVDVSQLELL